MVLIIGWRLGGIFGIGTIIFAILIGPIVALFLQLTGNIWGIDKNQPNDLAAPEKL